MARMKMAWQTAGQLTTKWVESEPAESYNPTWMQSSYPSETPALRDDGNRTRLSPFGKPRYGVEPAMMPRRGV